MKFKKLEISIPQIVTARDYHDFSEYEDFLNELGLNNIKITELGYFDGEYQAILHLEGDTHTESFQMMRKEFRELTENDDDDDGELIEEPFDADELLNKYYNKDGK